MTTATQPPKPIACPFCGQPPRIMKVGFSALTPKRNPAYYVKCETIACPIRPATTMMHGEEGKREVVRIWNNRAK